MIGGPDVLINGGPEDLLNGGPDVLMTGNPDVDMPISENFFDRIGSNSIQIDQNGKFIDEKRNNFDGDIFIIFLYDGVQFITSSIGEI